MCIEKVGNNYKRKIILMSSKHQAFLLWDCILCPAKDLNFISQLAKQYDLNSQNLSIVVSTANPKESKDNGSSIPPAISDLSIVFKTSSRFGPNAIFDSIVDATSFLASNYKNCVFILITSNFPIWISLFQRIPPKNLVIISNHDPRASIEFSFLPKSISVTIQKWPNLDKIGGSQATMPNDLELDYEEKNSPQSSQQEIGDMDILDESIEDENPNTDNENQEVEQMSENNNDSEIDNQIEELPIEEDSYTDRHMYNEIENDSENDIHEGDIYMSNSNAPDEDLSSPESQNSYNKRAKKGSQMGSTIQPLANIEKYNIDLKSSQSPNNDNSSEHSAIYASDDNIDRFNRKDNEPSKAATATMPIKRLGTKSNPQTMSVPIKFQPLIEAMKSIGKAMIALSDLESQLKIWSSKLDIQIENTNTYIARASDAGLIIYDKSINYIRFKNRQMANANIEYV